jgi:hypothetical protein
MAAKKSKKVKARPSPLEPATQPAALAAIDALTPRDHAALAALQALVQVYAAKDNDLSEADIARWAYRQADAFEAERKKKPTL